MCECLWDCPLQIFETHLLLRTRTNYACHSTCAYSQQLSSILCEHSFAGTIQLLASARENSNTGDDIFVTITGTDGSSPELVATHGITQRQTVTTPVYFRELGEITAITLRLSGNNGVHLDEVRLLTPEGNDYLWLFSSGSLAHGGWLDGDSSNAEITPDQTLVVAEAMQKLSFLDGQSAINAMISTVTAEEDEASVRFAIDVSHPAVQSRSVLVGISA